MIEEAVERGFTDILIGGFVGKLVKVASGTMNTHSHVADGRIETICTHAALHGAPLLVIQKLYSCLLKKTMDTAGITDYISAHNYEYLIKFADEPTQQYIQAKLP